MASVAARSTGKYSGLRPAITALAAILATVTARRRSGSAASIVDKGFHPLYRRGHHRETVRPAECITRFNGLDDIVPFHMAYVLDLHCACPPSGRGLANVLPPAKYIRQP